MAKKPRGFAAMNAERQREIASRGGRAAHRSGHAHEFTPEEAREAGRKGGRIVSRDRQHMSEIGRQGGRAAHQRGTAHEFNTEEARLAGRRGGRPAQQEAPEPHQAEPANGCECGEMSPLPEPFE